jgi:hypothetical protein
MPKIRATIDNALLFFSQKKSSLKKIKIKERAHACGPELEAHMPKSFF